MTDQIERFVSGVFGDGATTGNIRMAAGDQVLYTRDLEEVIAFAGDRPVVADLTTYTEAQEPFERAGIGTPIPEGETPSLAPTLVLERGADRYAIWLLAKVLDLAGGSTCEKLDEVAHLFEGEDEAPAYQTPLPGTGGWTMAGGSGEAYTVDEIHSAFCAPQKPAEPVQVNDALIYGDLDAALLDRPVEIALSAMGSKTIPGRWKNWPATVRDLLGVLSQHAAGEKDGNCFLGGAVIEGERKAQAIRHMDLLTLDLDTGENIDAIRARLQRLGLFGVIYTTHSHLKPTTSVKKDAVIKWIGEKRAPIAADVCNYLRDVKRYQPAVLAGAEIAETEHTKEGVQLILRHQPMAKFRVVLLLKERFVFAEANVSQADAIVEWKERYAGASKLLGAFFDRSCVDPSRLFYTPRHPKDAQEYRVEVIAGRPLDINEVERITANDLKLEAMTAFERAAHDATKDGQWKTTSLKWFFAKYGERFEIADFFLEMDGDGDRGPRPGGAGRVHRCPNDDQHTNAGEESDVAFICVNATESENGKAVALCRHDACSNLDRIDFTDMICQRAGITDATELKKWVPAIEGDDEEEVAEEKPEEPAAPAPDAPKPFKNAAEAKRAIAGMTENDEEAAIKVARRIGMSDFSPIEVSGLVKLLAKRSGIGPQSVQGEVRAGVKERKMEGGDDLDDDTLTELARFNKIFAVVEMNSKVRVLKEPKILGEPPTMLEIEAWRFKFANNTVLQAIEGEVKKVPVTKLWHEWPERRDYDSVVFEPAGAPKTAYNMWRGWPITPRKGDWSLLHDHIRENVCRDSEEYYTWMMTWMAQMYQQPGVKLGSAVAIQGKKGTGKSKVFDWLRAAMGPYATKVAHRNHVTGNFNAHQAGKILIVCEEAFWAGDVASCGILKDLITSSTMQLEKKGLDPIEVANYARLAFISNERWIVPAGLEDERRFFVLNCGDKRREDTAYFAAIDQQMRAGGLEAMLHDLLEWHPPGNNWNMLRTPPKTPWLVDQAVETMDIADRFFVQLISDGGMEGLDADDEGIELNEAAETEIAVSLMRKHFERFVCRDARGRHRVGNMRFLTEATRDWLLASPVLVRRIAPNGSRGQHFLLPPLTEIRASILARKGAVLDL